MKEKDHTIFSSYIISISIHILLLLIFMLIPVGDLAKPGAKSIDYYPVELKIIEGEKTSLPKELPQEIIEIKIEKLNKIPTDETKKLTPKEIKESKVVLPEHRSPKETKPPQTEKKIYEDKISTDDKKISGGEKVISQPSGVISLPTPKYTKTAENLEIEGRVEITFRTDEAGKFEKLDSINVEIFETAGQETRAREEIKQIALKTVERGQYGAMQGITVVCMFEKIGERFEVRCNEKK